MGPADTAGDPRLDRALGALYGLAIGDALGMPTQMLSRDRILERFGPLAGFEAADADHPIAASMPAGSITDDTEQALLLAGILVDNGGHVDARTFAQALIEWEDRMRERGSLDLLGPTTKRAVAAILDGASIEEAGRYGDTNGAAMRVTPVGLVVGSADLAALVDRVVEASRVTHNTGVAISGAAAVAAAVSAGIGGGTVTESIRMAVAAAELGASRGHWVAAANVARRIEWAVGLVDPVDPARSSHDIYELVGTSLATQESVPAAFGILATHPSDPWAACLAAASLGGDCDTIAAIGGAIGGACLGVGAFPAEAVATIRSVNDLDLERLATRLLALR